MVNRSGLAQQNTAVTTWIMMDKRLLDESVDALGRSLKRRLAFWAVRWILGFVAIGFVVYTRPDLAWLWWVGAAVATLSLIAMLVLHYLVQRRVTSAHAKIAEYEKISLEAEREALRPSQKK
jgi:hypothetical protein